MDYYGELKPQVDERVAKLAKERDTVARQITEARKRIEDETALAGRVKQQIDALNGLAGESLAGGDGEWAKYKTALRRRNEEYDTAIEAVETLRETVLPRLQESFTLAERKLNDALDAAVRDKVLPIVQQNLDAAIGRAIEEHYDSYIDGCTRSYAEYGEAFPAGQFDLVPSLSRNLRLNGKMPGLVVQLSAEQRIERLKKSQGNT